LLFYGFTAELTLLAVQFSGPRPRKLLVWKTNKEAQSEGRFPAYVVHWTDYSPSRAEPLDREVKLAPNENDARKIADDLVKENIKKGWERA
jgi:hypothetical protein